MWNNFVERNHNKYYMIRHKRPANKSKQLVILSPRSRKLRGPLILALHAEEWCLNASLKWGLQPTHPPPPLAVHCAGHPASPPSQISPQSRVILFCICLKIHRLVQACRFRFVTCYIWRGVYQKSSRKLNQKLFRRLAHPDEMCFWSRYK